MIKMTAFASGLALAGLLAPNFAAADNKLPCVECLLRGGGGGGGGGNDAGPGAQNGQGQELILPRVKGYEQPNSGNDQYIPRRRAKTFDPNDLQQGGGDQQYIPRRRAKIFDPNDLQQGGGDQQYIPRKRAKRFDPDDQFQGGGGNDNYLKKRQRGSKQAWRFDSNRHERRRNKDKRFRYSFGGFWYPQPYWDEPYYDDDYIEPSRVSCREGAEIVSERFNRVRIIECDGRVYTYLGRRRGGTFEIKLNARSGRIIDAEEI